MSLAGEAGKAVWTFGTGHMALVGSLALAAGLIIGYELWHSAVYNQGYDACKADLAQANADAKADHDKQQARIDELAKQSQPALAAKVAQQQKLVDLLVAESRKPPKVFTKDCTLPADQVQAYNSIK